MSDPESGRSRFVIVAVAAVVLLLLAGAGLWLALGGANKLLGMLPEGVAKTLGERPGEGKRVEQKLTEYPGEQAGTADEAAVDPEKLSELLQPLEDEARAVTARLEALRDTAKPDQAALNAAEQAVEQLRTFGLGSLPSAYRGQAEARRRVLAEERRAQLDTFKKAARATHVVTGTAGTALLELRKAADASAEAVAGLDDGVLVQVHLDTGKGWSRVDVLSGPEVGKGGYLQNGALRRLPARR